MWRNFFEPNGQGGRAVISSLVVWTVTFAAGGSVGWIVFAAIFTLASVVMAVVLERRDRRG